MLEPVRRRRICTPALVVLFTLATLMFPVAAFAVDDPLEEDSAESPPELTDAFPEEPYDPPSVDSESPDAPNSGPVGGTCPGSPGGTRAFLVIPEEDPILCPDGTAPAPGVTWTESRDIFKFRNADGVWWIYKRCVDTTSGGFRYTVGPGYIARVTRNAAVLVNDFRGRSDTWSPGLINAVNGGLGTFGWHHARGAVGGTPAGDDPTTSGTESGVGRNPKVIEGRMCPSMNGGTGVYARNWGMGPQRVSSSRVDFKFDVWFKERNLVTGRGPGSSAIARIRYVYSFYRSSVKVWIGVTTYADSIAGEGTPFVKEPKLTALSRGGNFTRLSVMGGADGNGFLLGMMAGEAEGTQVLSTSHSDHDTRKRVRWDFGQTTGGSEAPGCSSTSPCLNVVMRAYPMTSGSIVPGGTADDWEGSSFGLDRWAVLSGSRAKAYARDTFGDNFVSSCGVATSLAVDDTNGDGILSDAEKSVASERATPAQSNRRRWEVGGWKSGVITDPYQSGFSFFTGWEDDRGPEDCEPHQREFGAVGESFGTFASYSLNDGWTLQ